MYAFVTVEGLEAGAALEELSVPAEAGYVAEEGEAAALGPAALEEDPAAEGGGPRVMVGR